MVLSDDFVERKTPSDILDFLNSQVPAYKQIHDVEVLSVLPRNHSGKVMRHELTLKERQRAGMPTSE